MDKARFFPQIKFFGEKLSDEISKKEVLVVGIGGIGSWIVEMLARMGVKKIGVLDYDRVEIHNLTRQNYREKDVGSLKVDTLEERVREINSKVMVEKFNEIKLEYFKKFDLFFDCVDNIDTKYLLNEISVYIGKPYIFGTISGNRGFFGYIDPKYFCFYDIY
ncbi:ThiF family adenylyltransferase, partial [Nanoarchaeota archaeon NZ13-N]